MLAEGGKNDDARVGPFEDYDEVVTTMWLPTRDMGLGDAGTDVGMLQEAFGLPSTGVYDQRTSKKVARWQEANGLPRSGYFGAASRETFARSAQVQARQSTSAEEARERERERARRERDDAEQRALPPRPSARAARASSTSRS